jgi:Glutaredoxin-like domain (DUF836)
VNNQACGALEVKLYISPGCHLCEDAEAEVEAMRSQYPHTLERIDINTDIELTRRYWDQIPVLVVGEREYPAPLDSKVIERALRDATARDRPVQPTPQPRRDATSEKREGSPALRSYP